MYVVLSCRFAVSRAVASKHRILTGLAAYLTIWPEDGIMRMDDVRGVMDGSYMFKVAGDRRAAYDRKAPDRKKQAMRKLN